MPRELASDALPVSPGPFMGIEGDSTSPLRVIGLGSAEPEFAVISRMMEVSATMETYDHSSGLELGPGDLWTTPPVHLGAPQSSGDMHRYSEALATYCGGSEFPIFLGGALNLRAALIAGMTYQLDLDTDFGATTIVHLGARANLKREWGGRHYHDLCTHHRLWELGAYIVSSGVRELALEERDLFDNPQLNLVTSDPEELPEVLSFLVGPSVDIHLAVDLNVLDIVFAPAARWPAPGGLDLDALMDLIGIVFSSQQVVSADLLGLPTGQEASPLTQLHAAWILRSLVSWARWSQQRWSNLI